jgi:hypothetical protein
MTPFDEIAANTMSACYAARSTSKRHKSPLDERNCRTSRGPVFDEELRGSEQADRECRYQRRARQLMQCTHIFILRFSFVENPVYASSFQ